MTHLQIERGGLLPASRIQFVVPCEDGSAFAVTNKHGLDCLEIDDRIYCGFRLSAAFSDVCLLLEDGV